MNSQIDNNKDLIDFSMFKIENILQIENEYRVKINGKYYKIGDLLANNTKINKIEKNSIFIEYNNSIKELKLHNNKFLKVN